MLPAASETAESRSTSSGEACDRFEETVRACINPRTGRSAVERVYRMREHPLEPNGPDGDLVVVWSDPADAIVHPDVGMVGPLPFQRTGEHSANGFAFVSGPGIEHADAGTGRRSTCHRRSSRCSAGRPTPGTSGHPDRRRRPRPLMRVGAAPLRPPTPTRRCCMPPSKTPAPQSTTITLRKLFCRRYDIVHLHWPEWYLYRRPFPGWSPAAPCSSWHSRWARLRGARLVWTAHNLHPHERTPRRYTDWFFSVFTRLVDAVISPTESQVEPLRRRFPRLARTPTA